MDKKKILIYSSIAITVILIIASIVFYIKRKKIGTSEKIEISEFSVFPLKIGSKGTAVEQLQRHLNTKLEIPLYLKVDGIFGTNTEWALLWVYEIEEVPAEFYNKNKIYNY